MKNTSGPVSIILKIDRGSKVENIKTKSQMIILHYQFKKIYEKKIQMIILKNFFKKKTNF